MNINQDLNIKIKYLELELDSKITEISKLKDSIEEILNSHPPNSKDKINLDHIKYLYLENNELLASNKILHNQIVELNTYIHNIKYEFLSIISKKDEQLNSANSKIRYLENTNNSLIKIDSKLKTCSNSDNIRNVLLTEIVNKSTDKLEIVYKEKEKRMENQIETLLAEKKFERKEFEDEKNTFYYKISQLELKILNLLKEKEDLKLEKENLVKEAQYYKNRVERFEKNEKCYFTDIENMRNEIYSQMEENTLNKEKISKFERIAYGKLT